MYMGRQLLNSYIHKYFHTYIHAYIHTCMHAYIHRHSVERGQEHAGMKHVYGETIAGQTAMQICMQGLFLVQTWVSCCMYVRMYGCMYVRLCVFYAMLHAGRIPDADMDKLRVCSYSWMYVCMYVCVLLHIVCRACSWCRHG